MVPMKAIVFSARKDEKSYLIDAFEASGHEVMFEEVHLNRKTAELAAGFDAVVVFVNDQLDESCLERLAELSVKTVALRCAGYNNVNLDAAKRLGLSVVRVPAYSPYAVAEHALTLLMTLNRHVHKAYNRVREGNFLLDGLVGRDIHRKTVGVVGTGNIGSVFCQIMRGFDCRLLAYDPNPSQDLIEQGVEYVELDNLLEQSDFISLHCPLTAQTHHVISERALALMKPKAMLINTSRGGLVDTKAVINALKQGGLSGLAIDVYEEESDLFFEDQSNRVIADDDLMRLMTFPNVIVTGHQAFLTEEALTNIAQTTANNLTCLEQKASCENQLV
ncbi:2-hydroxyacid dehydrogenase [Marinobacterium sp. xm-a-127]|uniref:2-hydroxyacid dehydrogenase n=1 Tax=unclassified Marinobacterium TaxID=2644139 RepID=UPI0019D88412|nr:D-lactate dehydrogenase [Marinobacterium sp. xm-d-510]NRP97952.1 D-lactate dehydrogenase [Marinobacterium sp. xm-a-127]